jgi:hypothetical protein
MSGVQTDWDRLLNADKSRQEFFLYCKTPLAQQGDYSNYAITNEETQSQNDKTGGPVLLHLVQDKFTTGRRENGTERTSSPQVD